MSRPPESAPPARLSIRNLRVVYGGAVTAVHDLSLSLAPGDIFALLGTNGAGKSTTLKAISGLLASEGGRVEGSIDLDGQSLLGLRADQVVQRGVALVPEGRQLFAPLTVAQNLMIGGHNLPPQSLEPVLQLFPALRDKLQRVAGFLSGGEQQMVAIGRALMARPRILLLDEPSLGLAPMIVREIFSTLRRLRDQQGLTILLIEQNANLALDLADRACILENGNLVLEGEARALAGDPLVRELYLGRAASLPAAVAAESAVRTDRPGPAAQHDRHAWRSRARWPA